MRVIFLAAAAAPGLHPLTKTTPKCLLEVGGRTILSRAIGALVAHGLRRFTIVDGFFGDYLRADVLAEFPAEWFEFVRNDAYGSTGDACSLLLGRGETPEPIFLIDSDIVFDRRVVGRMLGKELPPDRLALRTRGEPGPDEDKVLLAPDGRITDLGKELDPRVCAGEAVNLAVLSEGTATRLFDVIERRTRVEKRAREGFEPSLTELIHDGLALHSVDLGDLGCMEIDGAEDLDRARRVFASHSSRPESYTTSHSFRAAPDSGAPSTGK